VSTGEYTYQSTGVVAALAVMVHQKINHVHVIAVMNCPLSWAMRRESLCFPYCFRHCPSDFFCLQVGGNPNHGYTNFDNFLWSMLTTFQLITLDYWENVYNKVRRISREEKNSVVEALLDIS
jgi:hypothetical protein